MVLKKWGEEGVTYQDLNGNFAEAITGNGLNLIRQLIDRDVDFSAGMIDGFAEAYVDSNGRKNSVNTGRSSADYDASTNSYTLLSESVYVEIDGDITNPSAFQVNNCQIGEYDTDKWVVWCTSGTDEEKRSQIYKTLFANDALNTNNFGTITAIRTTVSRDVGKTGYYGQTKTDNFNVGTVSSDSDCEIALDFTFADTTNNTDFSSWSNLYGFAVDASTGQRWEVPQGTSLNAIQPLNGSETSNEYGRDRTADEIDNPATARLFSANGEDSQGDKFFGRSGVYFIAEGTVTAVENTIRDTDQNLPRSFTFRDYNVDNGVPAFTATLGNLQSVITHDIPPETFASNVDAAIGVPFIDLYDSTGQIEYKLTNTGGDDTGWLPCENNPEISSFTQFSAEPETLQVRLANAGSLLTNFVNNPSFESAIGTDWIAETIENNAGGSTSTAVEQSTGVGVVDGSNCLRLFAKAYSNSPLEKCQAFSYARQTVDLRRIKQFSFHVETDDSNTNSNSNDTFHAVNVELKVAGEPSTTVYSESSGTSTEVDVNETVTFNVPNNYRKDNVTLELEARARVNFYPGGRNVKIDVRFDDFRIESQVLPPFVKGFYVRAT